MKEIDRAAVDRKTIRTFGRAALLIAGIVLMLAIAGVLSAARAEAPPASPTCPRCAPRQALEACLAETFGEYRSAAGQDVRGPIVFLFVNRGTGTWTIFATMDPAGATACVVAGGAGWRIDAGL